MTTFSPQARNAYGVTTGSYQYIDANGLLQTVNYIADPVNGFRVAGTNLPVAGAAPAVEPVPPPEELLNMNIMTDSDGSMFDQKGNPAGWPPYTRSSVLALTCGPTRVLR